MNRRGPRRAGARFSWRRTQKWLKILHVDAQAPSPPPHGYVPSSGVYVPLPHPAAAAVQRRELVLGSPSTRASTPQSRTQVVQ